MLLTASAAGAVVDPKLHVGEGAGLDRHQFDRNDAQKRGLHLRADQNVDSPRADFDLNIGQAAPGMWGRGQRLVDVGTRSSG